MHLAAYAGGQLQDNKVHTPPLFTTPPFCGWVSTVAELGTRSPSGSLSFAAALMATGVAGGVVVESSTATCAPSQQTLGSEGQRLLRSVRTGGNGTVIVTVAVSHKAVGDVSSQI